VAEGPTEFRHPGFISASFVSPYHGPGGIECPLNGSKHDWIRPARWRAISLLFALFRRVSLPASRIPRFTPFPSVKRERSALDKRPDCGFTKKGGCPATGVEKQVVGLAYLRQSGNKFLHAGVRNAYRQWSREPIRFAAKAPHIDELYSLNFPASIAELDQLHDFRL
jgi:hypothetical protein